MRLASDIDYTAQLKLRKVPRRQLLQHPICAMNLSDRRRQFFSARRGSESRMRSSVWACNRRSPVAARNSRPPASLPLRNNAVQRLYCSDSWRSGGRRSLRCGRSAAKPITVARFTLRCQRRRTRVIHPA